MHVEAGFYEATNQIIPILVSLDVLRVAVLARAARDRVGRLPHGERHHAIGGPFARTYFKFGIYTVGLFMSLAATINPHWAQNWFVFGAVALATTIGWSVFVTGFLGPYLEDLSATWAVVDDEAQQKSLDPILQRGVQQGVFYVWVISVGCLAFASGALPWF